VWDLGALNSAETPKSKGSNTMCRIGLLAFAVSLGVFTARANDILSFSEIGEDPPLITVKFNGAPLPGTIVTKQSPNDWTIQLPSGFLLPIAFPGVSFGETEPGFVNIVHGNASLIFFISDISAPPGTILPNPLTVMNAGTGPSGPIDLVLSDTLGGGSVPDGGTSLMLLTGAITALGLLRRFVRD
jgi:hypothetical protein